MNEKTGLLPKTENIFETGKKGRRAVLPPVPDNMQENHEIPEKFLRKTSLELPEISQLDLVRHFTNLSRKNFSVDTVFYPLGSCTMKYNPKINEETASLAGFRKLHPFMSEEDLQGMLQICHTLQSIIGSLTGLPGVCLSPAAGAHGELAGMMIISKFHRKNNNHNRRIILIPDTAHGTNPASAHLAGFKPVKIVSGSDGNIDVEKLKPHLKDDLAGIMITNPNTLGLFEKRIAEISNLIHEAGGLVYMDGANFNAIMGKVRPGDFGVDILHLNLHKTFSTPHGGGGPGSGPVAVSETLRSFLPDPVVDRRSDGRFFLDENLPNSIGRIRGFFGNMSVIVRAYTYIRSVGLKGLREAAETAVLNANYLRSLLKESFEIPYDDHCMHEFVLSLKKQKKKGAKALDFAKALIDYSIHPPTIYFPLIVAEAMMIEPTETESSETLERFAEVMKHLDETCSTNPESLTSAPVTTPVSRLDEYAAARNPVLSYQGEYQ